MPRTALIRCLQRLAALFLLFCPISSHAHAQAPSSQPADPPPISLHLTNANATRLAAALSERLHLSVSCKIDALGSIGPRRGGGPDFMLSIDFDQKPFWEAVTLLNQDQLVRLIINGNPIDNIPFRNAVRQGPFIAVVTQITHSRHVLPQGDDELYDPPISLFISLLVAADPRLPAVAMTQGVTTITDDAGHKLLEKPLNTIIPVGFGSGMSRSITLKSPANPGTILIIRGTAEFTLQLSESRLEIPDLQKQTTPISFAHTTITLSDLKTDPFAITLTAQPADHQPFPILLKYTLSDSTNTSLATRLITAPGSITLNTTPSLLGRAGTAANHIPVPPFKLTLSTPDQTEKRLFPYEFKDIPIPK